MPQSKWDRKLSFPFLAWKSQDVREPSFGHCLYLLTAELFVYIDFPNFSFFFFLAEKGYKGSIWVVYWRKLKVLHNPGSINWGFQMFIYNQL